MPRAEKTSFDKLLCFWIFGSLDPNDLSTIDNSVHVYDAFGTSRKYFLVGELKHVEPRLKLVADLAVVEIVADDVATIDVFFLKELDFELDVFTG